MKVFKKTLNLADFLITVKNKKQTIGFVPTMGALHQGHLSLIKHAQQNNDITVVSIFVNPTQFDNKEDLMKYPKPVDKDILMLKNIFCDVVFMPSVGEIYTNDIQATSFSFDGLEHQMEGKFRKGHFDGVGTIVKRLFEIVSPTNAYFGEKDFQQLQIIKKLVEKHNIPVNIEGRPIFREEDGLAMSSRNTRLTKEHREVAPFIYETLKKVKENFGIKNVDELTSWVYKEFEKHPLLNLEYFTIANESNLKSIERIVPDQKHRAFIAVFAGDIRLIDNISLSKN